MATENELQDLHSELVSVTGVVFARCLALDDDIPIKTKSAIIDEATKMREHALNVIKLLADELVRLESLKTPPPL